MKSANVLWFRHGLRLHDNPALLEAIGDCDQGIPLIPVFVFDGESAGTKSVGYNRMRFLLDSLEDLNDQLLEASNGVCGLYLLQGNPKMIFQKLHQHVRLQKICFEQDCEPIWNKRDKDVKELCHEMGIQCVEKVSHTLWDPKKVIATNGGIPPLTYQMFLHTVDVIGLPPRPVPDADWRKVTFMKLPNDVLSELKAFPKFPIPEDFNIYSEKFENLVRNIWKGGEKQAIVQLRERLRIEEAAFQCSNYLPNNASPNILDNPKSMSPHLRFGCLSVRRFYWDVHDLFKRVQEQASAWGFALPGGPHITGQLIWREYFYTMSVLNPHYDRMLGNDICLTIPWAKPNAAHLDCWKVGRTGFPIIDAAMRQLLSEGWMHHTLRNMVATFLTRGGLWQNWEYGLEHFLKYLLDADWSVCAGNWMWVSSSAFEQLLDSSVVTCPVAFGKRLDPCGEYIRQYVPELRHVAGPFIHEPWRMPADVQKSVECVIGVHYPERIIDFVAASKRNMTAMQTLRDKLMMDASSEHAPPHCRPSNDEEIRHFFWLAK